MDFENNRFLLNENDQDATGLPAEVTLEEAAVSALFLVEERIPELRERIMESQGGDTQSQLDQRELCLLYRRHFLAWDVKQQMTRKLGEISSRTGDEAELFLRSLAEDR